MAFHSSSVFMTLASVTTVPSIPSAASGSALLPGPASRKNAAVVKKKMYRIASLRDMVVTFFGLILKSLQILYHRGAYDSPADFGSPVLPGSFCPTGAGDVESL